MTTKLPSSNCLANKIKSKKKYKKQKGVSLEALYLLLLEFYC